MMGIPNEHLLKFNPIKDAKLLLEAIEKRFGRNEATKKTQMNLLKQQYENFIAPSSEMLDQTFDRLQKLRNKTDLDTMSMDDLYNNLKVYEPEVKGISSSSSSIQNMAFVSSSNNNTSSSNEAVNVAHGVTTSSTQVNTAYSTNINNLSDVVICSFFASQPNSPQLAHEDFPKWSATTATRGDIFARECRAPRNQDNKKESSRRSVPVETSTSTALVSCDGLGGYDWSLESVEEKLEFYKKNESVYVENINGLKWDIQVGEITISELRKKLEKLQKEKDSIQFNVDKFENASESLCFLVVGPGKRPIHKNTTFKNSNIDQRVNTVSGKKFNTARPKAVVNAVKGNNVNVIQVSDGLDPQKKLIFLSNVQGNPQMDLQDKGVIDSGCSRYITGNMSYLTNYKEIDGGYVAFGGNPKGGKITRKGKAAQSLLTEFKNREMNQFCEMKSILRQFSVARTPKQNGVAERRNRILIEAARTMLADSKLPTTFWAEVVNTACYFYATFGCPVTILNTIDHLGKFDGKADEGFFVGYSLNSSGPDWLFDIDALSRTMNYETIVAGTQSNGFAGTKASHNAGQARKETEPVKDYILLPLWTTDTPYFQDSKSSHDDGSKPSSDDGKKVDEDPRKDSEDQEKEDNVNNTTHVNTDEDDSIFDFSRDDEDDGAVADMNNLDTTIKVSPNPATRIHKDHPLDQVIGDLPMIGSLIYLTSSIPDIMFVVCAYARYQVNPKVSHLHVVKRIFRYLKGQPKLGLWYPKDSPFDLVAYTDSDYAGASLDRKSTTEGCQFLGCRLISWQCKKQTVVANSITEAEYVAASSCCGQVLWIQNQLLDYSLYLLLLGKAKKSVRLMMEKLFGMELKLILATSKLNTARHYLLYQGFIYGVSDELDTAYSSKSDNGLEFV
ncbi:ribonuclease H-like domain-containing protein [Tanacetum coccineum]